MSIRGRTPRAYARARTHGERGAVAVEFALMVPLLVILVFGIIQFGIVFSQDAALASASRSGARAGSVNLATNSTCQDVVDATREQAAGLGMSATDIKVTVKMGDPAGSIGTVCSAAAGVGTVTYTSPYAAPPATTSTSPYPCKVMTAAGPSGHERLYVEAHYADAQVSIPFLPSWDMPLTKTGVYRCEYS